MKTYVGLLSVMAIGLFATGCNSIRAYPKQTVSEKKELARIRHYFTDDVIKIYSQEKTTEAAKKSYRDEVVNGRIRGIDLQFTIFEKGINVEKNATQIGSDWAVLALSGAGATVGAASTKAILAAISGGITGAKLSFDKTLYYEKTMPALLAQMEANRSKQLLIIRIGLTNTPADYPLGQALVDLDNYYRAGTLPSAITEIGEV